MAATPQLVTRRELAEHLGVHPRTVARFVEENLPVAIRGRGGRASLFDLRQARAWLRDRERRGTATTTARGRKELAQALEIEQRVAMRARTLLDPDDVRRTWQGEQIRARAIVRRRFRKAARDVFRAALVEGRTGVENALQALGVDTLRELGGQTT